MAPSQSAKSSTHPEYAVRRETISAYFHPPLPRSTFHDLVSNGKIVPFKSLRGFYMLNASLKRLGLKEVEKLPTEVTRRSVEDILRLAFSMIDQLTFPIPPWTLTVEALDNRDLDHAWLHCQRHQEHVNELDSVHEKLAYFDGVLTAQTLVELESGREVEGS